jgi:hypothetical protein
MLVFLATQTGRMLGTRLLRAAGHGLRPNRWGSGHAAVVVRHDARKTVMLGLTGDHRRVVNNVKYG